jgi:hypothetical protein
LDKYISNIKDVMLDIPNANIKILQLIDLLPFDKNKNVKYTNIIKNIIFESDDSDSESDTSDNNENESIEN